LNKNLKNPEREGDEMRKFIAMRLVLILSLLLTACAKTVYVPTQCPRPQLPSEPRYATQSLRPGDTPDKVAKAYVASLEACMMDNQTLRKLCEG
jgi:hypothetical protein